MDNEHLANQGVSTLTESVDGFSDVSTTLHPLAMTPTSTPPEPHSSPYPLRHAGVSACGVLLLLVVLWLCAAACVAVAWLCAAAAKGARLVPFSEGEGRVNRQAGGAAEAWGPTPRNRPQIPH